MDTQTIAINNELLREAQQITPSLNDQEIVENALRTWIALQHKQLERTCQSPQNKPISCYDLAKHLIGSIQGPTDLSTNKAYMQDFGQ